jgi:Fur family transcriptional regulator, ferric uptake regulator
VHHFDLLDRLRHRGFRLTRQREVILQALSELDGHASVEQVHAQASLYCTDLDLSTVYRTLETLCELRVLSCADLGQGHVQFEIVAGAPHHHLICQGCGQVVVLDHSYLDAAADAIRRDFGFEPIFDHFAIFGLCAACSSSVQEST